jgi:hypothetical protein
MLNRRRRIRNKKLFFFHVHAIYIYIICNFKNYVVYLAKFLIVLFFKMFCFYQATFFKKKEKSMLIKRSYKRRGGYLEIHAFPLGGGSSA